MAGKASLKRTPIDNSRKPMPPGVMKGQEGDHAKHDDEGALKERTYRAQIAPEEQADREDQRSRRQFRNQFNSHAGKGDGARNAVFSYPEDTCQDMPDITRDIAHKFGGQVDTQTDA